MKPMQGKADVTTARQQTHLRGAGAVHMGVEGVARGEGVGGLVSLGEHLRQVRDAVLHGRDRVGG